MPEIIIVSGPNGAGKTSFANTFLVAEKTDATYLNADEIARGLAHLNLSRTQLDLRAGREMLLRIDALAKDGASFIVETTLASLTYARKIPMWQAVGYEVALIYLRLPNVESSIERVRRRVAAGGHDIPAEVIRQRFAKSAKYLESHYKPIVDEWYIWSSLEGDFRLTDTWDRR